MSSFEHPFPPVFDKKSNILILGTFPSRQSREQGFYYSYSQNRFWKVIATLTATTPIPQTIEAKKSMLFLHRIALYDVIRHCEIKNSEDKSIKNVIPVDLFPILQESSIKKIYTNGRKAYELYQKYFYLKTKKEAFLLPSTSSANAKYDFESLVRIWRTILQK